MWNQLKDGFKEFASDALKEGGELVKDGTETTVKVSKEVSERTKVVTETLRERLELSASDDLKPDLSRDTSGTAEASSSQKPVRPLGIKFKPMGGEETHAAAKPLVEESDEPKESGAMAKNKKSKGKQPASEKKEKNNEERDAVAKAISEAMATDTTEGDAPNTNIASALDDLKLELEAVKARAAESDRRAVKLAMKLAQTLAETDATKDGHTAATEARVKSLKNDNEQQHMTLEDLKKTLRRTNVELEQAEMETKNALKERDDAIRDMTAAEDAAANLRRQAAQSESAGFDGSEEKSKLELALASAIARAEGAETTAAQAKLELEAAESARKIAERESLLASENARQALASLSAERMDKEEASSHVKKFKEESKRRAATFENAVRDATSSFRDDLEKERDLARSERDAAKKKLGQVNDQAREAMECAERAETATRAAEAERQDAEARSLVAAATARKARGAGEARRAELTALKLSLEEQKKRADVADNKLTENISETQADRAAAAAATTAAEAAEQRATEATSKLERAETKAREFETRLRGERKQAKETVDALEQELEAVRGKGVEMEQRATNAETQWKEASDSGETKKRSSQNSKPADTFALGGLGLERVSLSQSNSTAGIATVGGGGGLMKRSKLDSKSKLKQLSGASPFGAVSLRTWLLVAYLVCLHVMAMVTPRHNVHCALENDKMRLPGL